MGGRCLPTGDPASPLGGQADLFRPHQPGRAEERRPKAVTVAGCLDVGSRVMSGAAPAEPLEGALVKDRLTRRAPATVPVPSLRRGIDEVKRRPSTAFVTGSVLPTSAFR